TVDAVEPEAESKLKELNHRRHRDLLAELDDYETRLTAAIQGYRVPEARQFIKDHQVEVERCAALQEYRDSSRWTALVEASGSGESVRLRRPTSSVSPLPTFVANAGLDFERPQHLKMADPQFVRE